MNEKLIKQLREGTIALKNDGTLEELNKVLRYAFPNDVSVSKGFTKYYFVSEDKNCSWNLDTIFLYTICRIYFLLNLLVNYLSKKKSSTIPI